MTLAIKQVRQPKPWSTGNVFVIWFPITIFRCDGCLRDAIQCVCDLISHHHVQVWCVPEGCNPMCLWFDFPSPCSGVMCARGMQSNVSVIWFPITIFRCDVCPWDAIQCVCDLISYHHFQVWCLPEGCCPIRPCMQGLMKPLSSVLKTGSVVTAKLSFLIVHLSASLSL